MSLAARIRANSEYTTSGFFAARLTNIHVRREAAEQPHARRRPIPPRALSDHHNWDILVLGSLVC